MRNPGKLTRVVGAAIQVAVFTSTLACTVHAAFGDDWPAWRGPNQTGSTAQGQFPIKWDAASPAWKAQLPGKGTSTPIVHDGRVYVTSPSEEQDAILAFDLAGKKLWETKIGQAEKPKHRNLASSGNASPVTDGKNIFVYYKSGNFAAVGLDGKVKWKNNIVEQFGREQLFWDQGTSPMLTEKNVVLARMHSGESWIAGFDKETGGIRWKEARSYKVPTENDNGYTTPVLFEQGGKKALLVWGADHLTAHDAENGKVLWELDGFNPKQTGYWPYIASPVIIGKVAVVPAGRDDRGQAAVHGIQFGETPTEKPKRIWVREDTGVFVPSPIAYNGRVYLLRNRGEIVCMDPVTGKSHWTFQLPEHRTPYYASPVIANGLLYAAREDGMVFAGRISDSKFELLGQNDMKEQIIASPVPAAERLFIRTSNHVYCLSGK